MMDGAAPVWLTVMLMETRVSHLGDGKDIIRLQPSIGSA